jgi:hypothetical protein
MRAHIRTAHPHYFTPGWPALDGVHGAWPDEGEYPLPSKTMAMSLSYGDGEEQRLDVSESNEWMYLGLSTGESMTRLKRRVKKEEDEDKDHLRDQKRARVG